MSRIKKTTQSIIYKDRGLENKICILNNYFRNKVQRICRILQCILLSTKMNQTNNNNIAQPAKNEDFYDIFLQNNHIHTFIYIE